MKYSPTRMVGASPSTVPLSACESGPDAPITLCGREVRRTRTQTRRSGASTKSGRLRPERTERSLCGRGRRRLKIADTSMPAVVRRLGRSCALLYGHEFSQIRGYIMLGCGLPPRTSAGEIDPAVRFSLFSGQPPYF